MAIRLNHRLGEDLLLWLLSLLAHPSTCPVYCGEKPDRPAVPGGGKDGCDGTRWPTGQERLRLRLRLRLQPWAWAWAYAKGSDLITEGILVLAPSPAGVPPKGSAVLAAGLPPLALGEPETSSSNFSAEAP